MTTIDETQVDELRKLVGVSADCDGPTIVAAVREALDEQAEAGQITTSAALAALRANDPDVLLLDKGIYDAMQTERRELAELRAEKDDQAITAALRRGLVTPAMVPGWQAAMRRDPASTKAELAKLTTPIVPMAAIGYDDPAAGPDIGPNGQPIGEPGWAHNLLFPEDKKASTR
jgi:hypothetical protein